jgi:hypothetical protein
VPYHVLWITVLDSITTHQPLSQFHNDDSEIDIAIRDNYPIDTSKYTGFNCDFQLWEQQ